VLDVAVVEVVLKFSVPVSFSDVYKRWPSAWTRLKWTVQIFMKYIPLIGFPLGKMLWT